MVSRLGSERLLGVSPHSFRDASGIRGSSCPRVSSIGRRGCSTSDEIARLSQSTRVIYIKILLYRGSAESENEKYSGVLIIQSFRT